MWCSRRGNLRHRRYFCGHMPQYRTLSNHNLSQLSTRSRARHDEKQQTQQAIHTLPNQGTNEVDRHETEVTPLRKPAKPTLTRHSGRCHLPRCHGSVLNPPSGVVSDRFHLPCFQGRGLQGRRGRRSTLRAERYRPRPGRTTPRFGGGFRQFRVRHGVFHGIGRHRFVNRIFLITSPDPLWYDHRRPPAS